MLCLHGKPAVTSTTENGTFWSCGEPSTCFVCSEEEKQLYDKAIKAFLATKQDRPSCCGIVPATQVADIERYWTNYYKYRAYTGTKPPKRYNPYKYLGRFVSAADAERHYAKFRVYTGKERHTWWSAYKKDIGRPFFTCGNGTDRNPRGCGYFEWGDKSIVTRPLCDHGKPCRVDGRPGERPFLGVRGRIVVVATSSGVIPLTKRKERNEPWLTDVTWVDSLNLMFGYNKKTLI